MKTLINNATIINEGSKFTGSVLIHDNTIAKIFANHNHHDTTAPDFDINPHETNIIDATNLLLIPGVIDDQVHFREPGFTHKGDIATESRAAVAGGVTSYMDMPNTNPQTTTQALLEQKYLRAENISSANYSFYIGATNNNIDEVLNTNPAKVCGVKVFMGSSTGNMLVSDDTVLSEIFKNSPVLVAVHCEDEATIRKNTEAALLAYGDDVPPALHAHIRSDEACYISSSKAINLASKHNTRLHVLHLSSAKEMSLFTGGPVENKNITAEVCVHHLWFDDRDYAKYGSLIKWNPSIKTLKDKEALWDALLSDKIDVIATDHAPHTAEEKHRKYFSAPSGGPLVQHSLLAMLELSKRGLISVEKVVQKMCHAPADLFRIDRRGYIREGYFADLVLINPAAHTTVSHENILYKCGWSPFEGITFSHEITQTFVNGHSVFANGQLQGSNFGHRLIFSRTT